MLFSGWASVRPERVHLHAVAHAQVLGVLDAVALAADLLPQPAHGAQLGVLLHEADAGVHEEREAAEHPREGLLVHTRADLVEDRLGGGQRVGDLLHRRGPGLLQVVGADVDRVPLGHLVDGEGDHVGDQPHRGLGRERVGPAREELLDDVVLGGAGERVAVHAVLLRRGHVERQQPGGGGVDRHRRVHRVERDAVQQRVHVALVGDRHAHLADLAAGQLGVGVVAGLGGQVEGDRQAGLALGEVLAVQLVGLRGAGVPGVGAHHPGPVGLLQAMWFGVGHEPELYVHAFDATRDRPQPPRPPRA